MDARERELATKVTKASVDYSKGMATSRCGICEHFQKPDSCTKVAGRIDPQYWCRLFKKG